MKLCRVVLTFLLLGAPPPSRSRTKLGSMRKIARSCGVLDEATPAASAPFSAAANPMMHVPVSNLHPGAVPPEPTVENPLAKIPRLSLAA